MACKSFQIENLSLEIVESTIHELNRTGSNVNGLNPWHVNLNKHGIKLIANYNPSTKSLTVNVTNKKFYVSCKRIEKELRNKVRLY